MKEVKILDRQTFIDVAAQELGDPSRALEIADLNERNVTDELEAGEVIIVPDYDLDKRSLVNLFSDDANKPASAWTTQEKEDAGEGEGIGFWIIENDFVVQ
jgi:hypothetical protein